jgi:hypothetical protein
LECSRGLLYWNPRYRYSRPFLGQGIRVGEHSVLNSLCNLVGNRRKISTSEQAGKTWSLE